MILESPLLSGTCSQFCFWEDSNPHTFKQINRIGVYNPSSLNIVSSNIICTININVVPLCSKDEETGLMKDLEISLNVNPNKIYLNNL